MRTRWKFLALGLWLLEHNTAFGQQAAFTKITSGAIVNDGGASWSCAWGDYDGDGYLDLFVSNGDFGAGKHNFLYHNNRDGTFTPIVTGAIVTDVANFRGCAWVDIDNDGYLDLSVVSHGTGNLLYHNNGDGTFTRLTNNAVTRDVLRNSIAGSWADFDRDGYVDFFVANANGVPNFLYRNKGDNVFAKITTGSIVTDIGDGESAAWTDYNADGFPDLFVTNWRGPKGFLYLNDHDGSFSHLTNTAVGAIVTDAADSPDCAWGDYDNDGFPDLFVANSLGESCFFYHNQGDGTFLKITNTVLTAESGYWRGCAWGDYDNDGYLDLFVASAVRNALYHNNGDGSFSKITNSIVTSEGGSFGCSWGDYDNDGFLDLFVANGAAAIPIESNNYLYHNSGNSNAWIKIKCVGTVSNRSAIGAKVRVKAAIGGKTFWQLREVSVGDGFASGSPLETHFGLGDATNIDVVRIEWPSGTVQTLTNVSARQLLTVTEPPRLFASATNGIPQLWLKGGRGLQYGIQTSGDLETWFSLGTLTVTNANGIVEITDTNIGGQSKGFYRAAHPR